MVGLIRLVRYLVSMFVVLSLQWRLEAFFFISILRNRSWRLLFRIAPLLLHRLNEHIA